MLSRTKSAGKDAAVGGGSSSICLDGGGGSGSRGGKESLDLKQTDRRDRGSRRLDADATAEERQADWKPSAKLFNPHSWPGPDQQSSPGNWQQDTPDVFPYSYWFHAWGSRNVNPGASPAQIYLIFFAHKHLSDELWQGSGKTPDTH